MISTLRKRLRNEKGFTLIELLVVMVILGILVAIAVPSYLTLKGKAHAAAAESDVRAIIPDIEQWYADHDQYTGMTIALLKSTYDQSINTAAGVDPVYTLGTLGASTYCVQVKDGSKQAMKNGPDAPIVVGDAAAPAVTCA
jgi:prepilin-type N-terminal cleavage/methylation domain-containing protein